MNPDCSTPKAIALIGYMYSGKSSVAHRLSYEFGIPSYDLDDIFEERYHTTIPIFFKKYDEPLFRKLETQLLQQTLTHLLDSTSTPNNSPAQYILATGGGTPCYNNNMELIKQYATSIYLRYSSQSLYERMLVAHHTRPVLAAVPVEQRHDFIAQQLHERNKFYSQADIIIDADKLSTKEICQQIIDELTK